MSRRGLSLLEVLLSLVLLAALGGTCVALMRAAAPPARESFDLLDLARAADRLVLETGPVEASRSAAGLEGRLAPWPDDPARPPIRIRHVARDGPPRRHEWIVFECGNLAVSRWRSVAAPRPGEAAP